MQAYSVSHEQDVAFFEAHYDKLLADYKNQWIAILGEQVVCVSDDAFDLIAKLKVKGMGASGAIRRHMTAEAELLILGAE